MTVHPTADEIQMVHRYECDQRGKHKELNLYSHGYIWPTAMQCIHCGEVCSIEQRA